CVLSGSLRPVQVFEQRPRPVLAQRIAAGTLDLDDVGTRVAEQLRAIRPRDVGGAVDDANPIEHGSQIVTAPTGPVTVGSTVRVVRRRAALVLTIALLIVGAG